MASPDISQRDRLAVKGDPADAIALVPRVLEEVGPTYRLFGDAVLIDGLVRQVPGLVPVHNFFWMESASPPDAATAGVQWLDAQEEKEATFLFDRFFPDSYAQPGGSGVQRWAGVVGDVDGGTGPVAVAADAWSAAECGFMAGVVTHPAARGHGHARSVCGFVVDALVRRYGRAALMVHDDNTPAVTTYERLGMTKRLLGAAHIPAQ
ncbi:GNAT family N-acetyltransferase [Streptomyces sp. NPDC001635]